MEVIKLLEKQNNFPIARAQMRLLIESPRLHSEILRTIKPLVSEIESDESVNNGACKMTVLIDPGNFRVIHESVGKITKNQATIITLNLKDLKDSS